MTYQNYYIFTGSGDIMFIVAEGQNSTSPHLNLSILFISKLHDMPAHAYNVSGLRYINLRTDFRYWSHISTTTSDK